MEGPKLICHRSGRQESFRIRGRRRWIIKKKRVLESTLKHQNFRNYSFNHRSILISSSQERRLRMGPWRKGSTSSSGGIEDQKSTGLSKRQSVVVEVIENQARTEDTEAKAEDSQGKAKDTQVKGNPFKEVEIILTPDGLGKEHKEVSKEDGKATFLDVPEGDYIVTAKKDGFKFQQIAITSGPLKDEHKSRKISENVLNVEERLNAVRKVGSTFNYFSYLHKM